jgi:hypothetical protein
VAIFPPGATFRLGSRLEIQGRRNLTLWGYQATLLPDGAAELYDSTAIRVSDSRGVGILGFRIRGENEDAGTREAHHPDGQFAMGIALAGGAESVEIADNHISHTFGDGVFLYAPDKPVNKDVDIHHNLIELTGRQGIVANEGERITLASNVIRDVALAPVDAEDQRGATADLTELHVLDNHIERWNWFDGGDDRFYTPHAFQADYDSDEIRAIRGVRIERNVLQGGDAEPIRVERSDGVITMWGDVLKEGVYIRDNLFELPPEQRVGWAMRLRNVSLGEISGNSTPGQSIECRECDGVDIAQ